ncbi:MAG: hypothetical protein JWM10_4155 [Myxococcaceae bacterium]|nr:hypothetical protein [Myxococcaceae bacterium]
MHDRLSRLRAFVGHEDVRAAFAAEARSLRQAATPGGLDARLRAEMAKLAASPAETAPVGTTLEAPHTQVRVPLRELVGGGHSVILGGTGAGKTRAVASLARAYLRRFAANPRALGFWVIDHKSDLVALVRGIVRDLLDELPAVQVRRLLDALVVIDPFSTEALVPLQVLHPEPGVAPEVQAFEVTSLINRMGGADLGVRQDQFLYHLLLLGVVTGRSLPEVARLIDAPEELARAAARSPSDEVQAFLGAGARLNGQSLDGVRARLHAVLRLPAARLMMGAKGAVSFHQLLGEKIVLIDVGSAPRGCQDLARFWAGFMTTRFVNAIFERSAAEAARPVAVLVDEWQEGLGAGSEIAEDYERVLSMARSRGVSLHLISQSLDGAAKVSARLPKIVATNTNVQLLFRASIDDARAMAHLLPVTSSCRRPRGAPWDEKARTPFLTPKEERDLLVEAVPSLPNRTFYYWNRLRPYRAVLLRAPEVVVRDRSEEEDLFSLRVRRGVLAVPIAELDAQVNPPDESFRTLTTVDAPALARPTRRPRGG